MAERRVIKQTIQDNRTVVIREKPSPQGEVLVEKTVEYLPGATRGDLNVTTGLLDFLHNITHDNLCRIENYKVNQGANIRLEVFMEACMGSCDMLSAEIKYSPWYPHELAKQIDGLVSVLAHAQSSIKLIGFAPVTRGGGKEVALARAISLVYLSPAREEVAVSGAVTAQFNEYKSDVYSLGVCMLQLLFLGYDLTSYLRNRDFSTMLQYLSEFGYLQKRLSHMLLTDESQRPDFTQFAAMCSQWPIPLQTDPVPVAEPPKPAIVSAKPAVPSAPGPAMKQPPRQEPNNQADTPANFAPKQPVTKPFAPLKPGPSPAMQKPSFQSQQKQSAPFSPSPPFAGLGGQSPSKKFSKAASDDSPDILSGPKPPVGQTYRCKFCGIPFEKRHSANRQDFEKQFEDFCSEDCVTNSAIKKSMQT